MTYVLIIMSWFTGDVSGYQITNIEFGNERACLEAAEQVASKTNSPLSLKRVTAVCARKGDRI